MTRIALAIAVLAAAVSCDVSRGRAATYGDAPWCAVQNFGAGDMQWDCEYATAAACAPNVVAGSRGFCNRNPYFVQERPPYRRPHRHHRAYRQ